MWSAKAFLSRWYLNRDPNEEMETSWEDILEKTFQVEEIIEIKVKGKKELGIFKFQDLELMPVYLDHRRTKMIPR